MKKVPPPPGIDLDYLRRCKESTPGQRLDWLGTALEFVIMLDKAKQKKTQKK